MRELFEEFRQGLREGPVLFFAPLIGIWKLVARATAEVEAEARAKASARRSGAAN